MTDTNDHLRDLHKIKKSDVPMFGRPTEGTQPSYGEIGVYSDTKYGEHSRTPWRCRYEEYHGGYVISIPHMDPKQAGGRGIGICNHSHQMDLPKGCAGECPHNKANAEFICKAVNLHAKLLAALEKISNYACTSMPSGEAGCWHECVKIAEDALQESRQEKLK